MGAPDMIRETVYLILDPRFRGQEVAGFAVRARSTKPRERGASIAIKLAIPKKVFEPFIAEVMLELDVSQVAVEVEVEPVEIAVPE